MPESVVSTTLTLPLPASTACAKTKLGPPGSLPWTTYRPKAYQTSVRLACASVRREKWVVKPVPVPEGPSAHLRQYVPERAAGTADTTAGRAPPDPARLADPACATSPLSHPDCII